MLTSSGFACVCGNYDRSLILTKDSIKKCPFCSRKYIGKYNIKTRQIDAIEVPKGGNRAL